MERLLHTMAPLSPVGLAIIACVAFGLALAAREALGVERGLRAAAERARDAAVKTLTTHKNWELHEIERYRRLLGCHIDAIVAEATEFRERLVPSPGGILESLCSWNADWKRDLARSAGLRSEEVERLLKNELPITPGLARSLERFTGAPARYWEYLWRLHDEYRTETDETLLLLVDQATRARRHPARVPAPGFAPAPLVVGREPAPSAPAEIPAPATAHPELVVSSQRGALPPPPRPRSPRLTASRPELRPARAAPDAGRADRPIQRQDTLPEIGDAWDDLDRSPLNATLPGVGRQRPPR
ncbi:helix-turn-helix transcriptional regulator [Sorangium sp. So ce590]|uniref:helix-turn-helix transcriptional regulator n=1 Tax=unclassified Sorangium TaxID=2621164 RepID=UPI003F60BCBB